MNWPQRIIIFLASLTMVAVVLYPPWVIYVEFKNVNEKDKNMPQGGYIIGYRFITYDSGPNEHIELRQFILRIAAVIVGAFGLYYVLRSKEVSTKKLKKRSP